MYLSVTTIVLGELLLTRSRGLLAYWAIWFAAVNLFVIGYEEPTLRHRFGASYDDTAKPSGVGYHDSAPANRASEAIGV
jgi:protein-S-isoprenylcysteine O-methyltransferase Ste14